MNSICDQVTEEIIKAKFRSMVEGSSFRLGLDIHGVIDADPGFFSELTENLVCSGQEVHVLTGSRDTPELREQLKGLGIHFTHLFSVATHHEKLGTNIWYTTPDDPWMDEELWNRTKAEYCAKNSINLMLDDSEEYGKYFTTPYFKYSRAS